MSDDESSRITRPIQNAISANWDLPLTHEDYSKILKGSRCRDMDDRWICVTDTPDAKGNTIVHIARSWTGHEYISITVEAGDANKTEGNEWGRFTSVTWDKETLGELGRPIDEKETKEDAVGYCRGLMGCKLGAA